MEQSCRKWMLVNDSYQKELHQQFKFIGGQRVKWLNMNTECLITSFHPTSWTNCFLSLHYSIQCGESGDYCSNNNDCCSRQCYNQRCSGGGNVSTFTLHRRRTRIAQIIIINFSYHVCHVKMYANYGPGWGSLPLFVLCFKNKINSNLLILNN